MIEKRSITAEDRTLQYLKDIVKKIYWSFVETCRTLYKKYPHLYRKLPEEITFITSQELEDRYPDDTPEKREYLVVKEYKAVFIIGIWDRLKSGVVHGKRSPDYDDWSLDWDWLMYDEKYDRVIELSSMWIRVSKDSLVKQLEKSWKLERLKLPYHQSILKKELPYTIWWWIWMTRLIMFILWIYHIAEVQASSRGKKTIDELKEIDFM